MKGLKIAVNKRKIILILICIFVIMLFLCLLAINKQKKIEEKVEQYTSIDDFATVEEVLIYKECNFLKQEKSNTEGYDYDIYVRFKQDLYSENKNNKEYYDQIIGLVANVLNQSNFILIDEAKDIVIEVKCDQEKDIIKSIVINGDANYFEHQDSNNALKNYTTIDTVDITIQAKELNDIINANWVASKIKLGTIESTFDKYDIYSDEGIKVKNVYKKIFNIVFTKEYKENVINDIKVGASKETIIEKLGKPTFETNKFIGYKGKDIYVFFLEDEISIYRVEKFESEQFEKFLTEFDMNTVRKTISNLTDIWPDYDSYENNENYIEVTYSLKGIKVQINVTNEHGILVYSNYTNKLINQKTIQELETTDLSEYVYIKADKDLVCIKEMERIAIIENEEYIQALKSEHQNIKDNEN